MDTTFYRKYFLFLLNLKLRAINNISQATCISVTTNNVITVTAKDSGKYGILLWRNEGGQRGTAARAQQSGGAKQREEKIMKCFVRVESFSLSV